MVTTLFDLRVVLDAPAVIPTTISLISCSMNAGSKYGLNATVGAISEGLSSCPCPSVALGNHTSARRDAESS